MTNLEGTTWQRKSGYSSGPGDLVHVESTSFLLGRATLIATDVSTGTWWRILYKHGESRLREDLEYSDFVLTLITKDQFLCMVNLFRCTD